MMFFTTRNKSKRLVLVPLCAWVQSHANHVWLFATRELQSARLLYPWSSPGKNAEVICHALLQGVFQTQGSNPYGQAGSLPLAPLGRFSYLNLFFLQTHALFFFFFLIWVSTPLLWTELNSLTWEFMIHHQFCFGYLCMWSEFTIGLTRGSVTLLPELVLCTW